MTFSKLNPDSPKTIKELCNFFLSGKKGNFTELSTKRNSKNKFNFVEIPFYKDKHMEIIYSYLKNQEGEVIIENLIIYSKYWGLIKESFFTLEGFKGFTGKTKTPKCGIIAVADLENFNYRGPSISVLKHNRLLLETVKKSPMQILNEYLRKKYGTSMSYRVIKVISQPPNPWVRIEITIGKETFYAVGSSKKDAAKNFAVEYLKKNK